MKNVVLAVIASLSMVGVAFADTQPVNLSGNASAAVATVVTNPSFGSFYQKSTAAPAVLSLYTNGTVFTSDANTVAPIAGTGAQNGSLVVTGATNGVVGFTFAGPAAGTGIFPIANGGSNLNARLYQSATQGATTGTLITNTANGFTCPLVAGTCTIYLGAQIDIPATAVATGAYTSAGITVTANYN